MSDSYLSKTSREYLVALSVSGRNVLMQFLRALRLWRVAIAQSVDAVGGGVRRDGLATHNWEVHITTQNGPCVVRTIVDP